MEVMIFWILYMSKQQYEITQNYAGIASLGVTNIGGCLFNARTLIGPYLSNLDQARAEF